MSCRWSAPAFQLCPPVDSLAAPLGPPVSGCRNSQTAPGLQKQALSHHRRVLRGGALLKRKSTPRASRCPDAGLDRPPLPAFPSSPSAPTGRRERRSQEGRQFETLRESTAGGQFGQLPDGLVNAATGSQANTRQTPAQFSADGHRRAGSVLHRSNFRTIRTYGHRRAGGAAPA